MRFDYSGLQMNPFLLIQRSPIKRRRSKPRRGPLRDPKYRAWLTSLCCHVCWLIWRHGLSACGDPDDEMRSVEQRVVHRHQNYPTDPAHTKNNGTSSKGPDSTCAPLCRVHHDEYDAGRKDFEKKYSVDMRAVAASYWKRYQEEHAA